MYPKSSIRLSSNNRAIVANHIVQFPKLTTLTSNDTKFPDIPSIFATKIKSRSSKQQWQFLKRNKDILTQRSFKSSKLLESYSNVPTSSELYHKIRDHRAYQRRLIAKRKNEADEEIQDFKSMLTKVVEKQVSAHQQQLARVGAMDLKRANGTQEIVDIARFNGDLRTGEQLKTLKEWIKSHSKKNSIVYTFLQHCTEEEALELCRGLQYQIFASQEVIIRQGDQGDAYFIILNGNCNIYVNKFLIKGEVANEKGSGLGTMVDSVSMGRDFGEYSLISNEPRAASIKCKSITECLVCYRSHFKKCLEQHAQNRVKGVIKQARKFALFKGVSLAYLKQIFNRFSRIEVPSNTILQNYGKKIETILLVAKGKCREYLEIKEPNKKSRKKFIAESRDGDCIVGDYYVISNKRPKTNIITITPCQCLVISKDHFLKSITFDMELHIRSVGVQKEKLVKDHLEMFQKTIKYLNSQSNQQNAAITELKFNEMYARHGKWGKFEQISSDNVINDLSLSEPIRQSIMELHYRESKLGDDLQQITREATENMQLQKNEIEENNDNEKTTTNWVSIKNRKKRKRRRAHKSRPKTSSGIGYSLKDIGTLTKNLRDMSTLLQPKYQQLARAANEKQIRKIIHPTSPFQQKASSLIKDHTSRSCGDLLMADFETRTYLDEIDYQKQQSKQLKLFKNGMSSNEKKDRAKIISNDKTITTVAVNDNISPMDEFHNLYHRKKMQKYKTLRMKNMQKSATQKKIQQRHYHTYTKPNKTAKTHYMIVRTKLRPQKRHRK